MISRFSAYYSIRYLMTGTAAKKARTMKTIGTHNGTFHCDEVLACFMLKQLPEYRDAEIIRTRDQGTLDTCDIVVDVGGIYDPAKHRYDHHQRIFTGTMNSICPDKKWTTKLSSAGLVYCHFGSRVISEVINSPPEDPTTQIIYDKVYENFIEEIDAVDNGISQTDDVPRYSVSTTLSHRVGYCNSKWNETDVKEIDGFNKALDLVGAEFRDRVLYYYKHWLPARTLVEESIKKRHEVDATGEIICLSQGGCPWKDHLFTLEEELNISPKIKFVLYTDNNGKWRVQCVPVRLNSFENRLSLLEKWRGVRDSQLSELSGIKGCIFVHVSGFIGGNETYQGALTMAKTTLEESVNTAANGQ